MNRSVTHKTILTLVPYYEPGYKGGGPITTVKNSIDYLSEHFTFKVVTSDRDLGDTGPYPLPINQWLHNGTDVIYLSPDRYAVLFKVLSETEYDVLYLNSFFSVRFSILPLIWLKLRGASGTKAIVAPRGEFSKGALSIKPLKKKLYIAATKLLRLYNGVIWQASSDDEKLDIARIYGPRAHITVASDLPSKTNYKHEFKEKNKQSGRLNLVFLSRISRMKNLDFAIASLQNAEGDIQFDVYGPIEDPAYWSSCQELIAALPDNVTVRYGGAVAHGDVKACIERYDLFYLPSLGEGFGHAIFEAMQAACPVLISDRTPWNDIKVQGGGLVFPLEDSGAFADGIKRFVEMNADEYNDFSRKALDYSRNYMKDSEVVKAHLSLF